MALNDYEFSFNDLVFGMDQSVEVIDVDGLTDLTVGLGDSKIPRGSGDVPGLAIAKARSITVNLKVNGEKRSDALADDIKEALGAFAMGQEPLPLYFKEPGFDESFVYARIIGTTIPRKPTLTHTHRPFTIRFRAADPRVYGAVNKSSVLGVYDASGGGLDYDITDYSKEFTLDASASVVVTNDGNADAYPVITFFGPVTGTQTGATITNLTNDSVADFDFSSAFGTGATFSADMRRIVTVDPGENPYVRQSGSNKYGDWQLPRTPFYISPGDNELRFEVDGTTTDATASVAWRDTSL